MTELINTYFNLPEDKFVVVTIIIIVMIICFYKLIKHLIDRIGKK